MGKKTKMKFQNLILVFLLLISYSQQIKVQDTFEEVAYESAEAEAEEKFQTIEEDEAEENEEGMNGLTEQQIKSVRTLIKEMGTKSVTEFSQKPFSTRNLKGLNYEQIFSVMDIKTFMDGNVSRRELILNDPVHRRKLNEVLKKRKFAGFTRQQIVGVMKIYKDL